MLVPITGGRSVLVAAPSPGRGRDCTAVAGDGRDCTAVAGEGRGSAARCGARRAVGRQTGAIGIERDRGQGIEREVLRSAVVLEIGASRARSTVSRGLDRERRAP